jgi:hypothetical protein
LVNIERQGNTLTASANGGTPPYAYLWSTGDQEAAIIASENALYEVVVTDGKGCTAAALLDFNVASLQRWAQNIRIYPNPVTHWLMVENDNQEPLQSIQVLDNAGKTIEYYEASLENRYDLSKLTPGNYVLILTINNQRIPVKFVKQ